MYLSAAEACERLRLSRETLRKLIISGDLKAHKGGTARNSHYRISEQAIDDYLKRHTVQAAS